MADVKKEQVSVRNRKGASPYGSTWDSDYVPTPITLPRIDPKRHEASFRKAMDQVENKIEVPNEEIVPIPNNCSQKQKR